MPVIFWPFASIDRIAASYHKQLALKDQILLPDCANKTVVVNTSTTGEQG